MKKSAWELYKENLNLNIKVYEETPINFTKNEVAPGIWIYKNVFNNLDNIVESIETLPTEYWTEGQVAEHNDGKNISKINKKSRDCSVAVIEETEKFLYPTITNPLTHCLNDYLATYGIIPSDLSSDKWQILKYGNGQQFTSHADDGPRYPRTVSITSYLNDNYTGGEVEFKNFDFIFKPEKGDVLLFPSNYVYNHRVIPVETGIRYAVVNWFRWRTMKVDMES